VKATYGKKDVIPISEGAFTVGSYLKKEERGIDSSHVEQTSEGNSKRKGEGTVSVVCEEKTKCLQLTEMYELHKRREKVSSFGGRRRLKSRRGEKFSREEGKRDGKKKDKSNWRK